MVCRAPASRACRGPCPGGSLPGRGAAHRAALLLVLGSLVAGCTTKAMPRAPVVDRLDVLSEEQVEPEDVKAKIATGETKRVLGGALEHVPLLGFVDALTVEYQFLDRIVLQRDLDRVRRYYRSRGFYEAEVRAGRVIELPDGAVRVEIVVREGPPVLIESVDLQFPDWERAFETNATLHEIAAALGSEPVEGDEGKPRFDEARYDEAKAALLRALTDNGFAHGEVVGKAEVDLLRRAARLRFDITAGPPCTFGPIRFEGLDEIPEGPVRRALGFEADEPFSTEKMELAHHALADFGVFASVEIIPEIDAGATPAADSGAAAKDGSDRTAAPKPAPSAKQSTMIPVLVQVRPIKLRAVKLGIGTEIGSQIDVHGIAGWEHRNFLGGLRRFSADFHPGMVFFPTRVETIFSQVPTHLLPKARLQIDFKQPGFPEARTNTLLSAAGDIYPSRRNPVPDPVPDDFNILGYRDIEGAFGLDRRFHFAFWGGSTLYAAQFIKLEIHDPFSYNLDDVPPGIEPVVIPYLETDLWWDWRKNDDEVLDPIRPRKGVFFGTNLQFAGGFLQGDADDIRLKPELRAYAPVSRKVTFALRGAVGFLFPRNYGDSLTWSTPAVDLPADQKASMARDMQLLSFRALFSGGPNSNRGYGYREIGPYFNFASLSDDPSEATDPGRAKWQPIGGVALWELSAEVRIPLTTTLGAVVFLDASDVTRTIDGYRLDHPHLSPGAGLRVDTPVGPFRFDLGVRVPYLQHVGERVLAPEEGGDPSGESDSFPLALSLAIGEAY